MVWVLSFTSVGAINRSYNLLSALGLDVWESYTTGPMGGSTRVASSLAGISLGSMGCPFLGGVYSSVPFRTLPYGDVAMNLGGLLTVPMGEENS